jgi:VWFA-related protein
MPRCSLVFAIVCASVALLAGQNQPPVFRVGTDSVAVNVAVTRGSNPVPGLTADDFRLYDNDVLQHVAAVGQDAVPLDVSIVLDLSGSAFRDLDTARDAVRRMVSLLRGADRFRVLTMGVGVVNAVPWQPALEPDLSRIHFVLGHISLVADSVFAALLYRTDPDRRHLVVALTDGEDICSLISGESLRRAAERSGAVFHWMKVASGASVSYFARSDGVETTCRNASTGQKVLASVLSDATGLTGGTVHDARSGADAAAVAVSFDAIVDDFRHSYILHYEPEGVSRAGWHRLRVVTVQKGDKVRARPGYWGAEEGPNTR